MNRILRILAWHLLTARISLVTKWFLRCSVLESLLLVKYAHFVRLSWECCDPARLAVLA